MPSKITFESRFIEDLTRLADYISAASDRDTADRFNDLLLSRCEALLLAPGMGTPLGRRPVIRRINEGSYKIFIASTESEIIILRLWDGRRGREPYLPPK